MIFKEMTAEHHDFFQKPSHPIQRIGSNQMSSLLGLLRNKLGMSHKTASDIGIHASKLNSPAAYMSTFLHSAIEEQVDEYRKQSFAKFCLEISVYPSRNVRRMELTVEYIGEITIGYHSYVFKVQHNKTPKKAMHVRLSRGSIQVHFCGSWHPISEYLDEINTDWTHPECLKRQLSRQSSWWEANGKSFKITKLPGEIRNAIYDFVFPSEAQPFPSSKNNDRLAPTFQRSYTALMRTNKQLNREASHRFYDTTTFTLDCPHLFSKILDGRNHLLRNRLRRVRLSLDLSEYLNLFSSKTWVISTKPYVKRQLREMSNLKSLEIHFQGPSRIATKPWLEGACQKAAVNMVVDAAWPSIKGLPVTVTGYVKDGQKKAIEARVQSERDAYALFQAQCRVIGKECSLSVWDRWVNGEMAEVLEQGGVRLNGEPWTAVVAEENGALQWNSMTTEDLRQLMWCNCEKRCTLNNWDPAD